MTNKIGLEITERIPFAEGHEFGAAGPYERLPGWAHFAVDPKGAAHPSAAARGLLLVVVPASGAY